MEANISRLQKNISTEVSNHRPLRAIVEIIAGKATVYPIADSDADAQLILDALRFLPQDAGK